MANSNFLSKFFDKRLDKIFGSLWGRLFIVATQTVLSSIVLSLIFLFRQSGDIKLLKYAIVLAVGFIAGFSSRRFLTTQTRALKLLAALSFAVLSLAVLYTLSDGFLGLNLFHPLNKTPDWEGIIQLTLAALGAWLVLRAFRSAESANWIKDIPASPSRKTGLKNRPGIKKRLPKLSLPSGKKIIQKFSRVFSENVTVKNKPLSVGKSTAQKKAAPLAIAKAKTKSSAKLPAKISRAKKLAVAPAPKSKTRKPARPKKRRTKKITPKDIHFIGVEEHCCPYCLDPVEPHDPRGVKICPICKTHHHADCWGITGACQIPHSHE